MEVFCIHSGSGDCNAGTLHLLWIATEIWAVVHLYHCEKHHHSVGNLVSRTVCCQCLACIWYLCRQVTAEGVGYFSEWTGNISVSSWVDFPSNSLYTCVPEAFQWLDLRKFVAATLWLLNLEPTLEPLCVGTTVKMQRLFGCKCLISSFGSWFSHRHWRSSIRFLTWKTLCKSQTYEMGYPNGSLEQTTAFGVAFGVFV